MQGETPGTENDNAPDAPSDSTAEKPAPTERPMRQFGVDLRNVGEKSQLEVWAEIAKVLVPFATAIVTGVITWQVAVIGKQVAENEAAKKEAAIAQTKALETQTKAQEAQIKSTTSLQRMNEEIGIRNTLQQIANAFGPSLADPQQRKQAVVLIGKLYGLQNAVKFADGFPSEESLDALTELAENESEENQAVLAAGYNKIASSNIGLAVVGTSSTKTSIVKNVLLTRVETRTKEVPITRGRTETRTREVAVTRTRLETRQKEVSFTDENGEKTTIMEPYQVSVPYTEMVSQNYTVQVPYTENTTQTYTITVPYVADQAVQVTETISPVDIEMATREILKSGTADREFIASQLIEKLKLPQSQRQTLLRQLKWCLIKRGEGLEFRKSDINRLIEEPIVRVLSLKPAGAAIYQGGQFDNVIEPATPPVPKPANETPKQTKKDTRSPDEGERGDEKAEPENEPSDNPFDEDPFDEDEQDNEKADTKSLVP